MRVLRQPHHMPHRQSTAALTENHWVNHAEGCGRCSTAARQIGRYARLRSAMLPAVVHAHCGQLGQSDAASAYAGRADGAEEVRFSTRRHWRHGGDGQRACSRIWLRLTHKWAGPIEGRAAQISGGLSKDPFGLLGVARPNRSPGPQRPLRPGRAIDRAVHRLVALARRGIDHI